jgi:hypothetical protein
MLTQLWWWIVTPPHFLWRVPLVIVGGLLAWGLWWWLWDVGSPWAKLALRLLGRAFDRVAEALEWIPRKSKAAALFVSHVFGVCDGKPACDICNRRIEERSGR